MHRPPKQRLMESDCDGRCSPVRRDRGRSGGSLRAAGRSGNPPGCWSSRSRARGVHAALGAAPGRRQPLEEGNRRRPLARSSSGGKPQWKSPRQVMPRRRQPSILPPQLTSSWRGWSIHTRRLLRLFVRSCAALILQSPRARNGTLRAFEPPSTSPQRICARRTASVSSSIWERRFARIPAVDVKDPEGLLKWLGKDRAMVSFAGVEEVRARKEAFQGIVRQWIKFV